MMMTKTFLKVFFSRTFLKFLLNEIFCKHSPLLNYLWRHEASLPIGQLNPLGSEASRHKSRNVGCHHTEGKLTMYGLPSVIGGGWMSSFFVGLFLEICMAKTKKMRNIGKCVSDEFFFKEKIISFRMFWNVCNFIKYINERKKIFRRKF